MISVAQIGVGYWGPNLLRNLYQLNDLFKVAGVVDQDENRIRSLKVTYPDIGMKAGDATEILSDRSIDAVVIATPVSTHFDLVKKALEMGKHVFVEKPITTSVAEASELVELAEKVGKVLMVGHVFEYNAAVHKVEELITSGELGEIYYIEGRRLNLGKVRTDVDALWNLAPHDISIMNRWMKDDPVRIQAHGLYKLQDDLADAVFVHMEYEDGRMCHLHVSWLYPLKVRSMTVIGSRKMVIYDDTSPDAKISIYDKGIDRRNLDETLGDFKTFGEFQLIQRAGEITIPKIDFREPLLVELSDFGAAIIENRSPEADGYSGLRVVKCLTAASRSLQSGHPEYL
ncbi:Gfo/Idh/MocA family protein [Gemmatimonadota bacterium]